MSSTEPIRFHCDACDKNIKVTASSAGKRGKCPHCEVPITVPEPEIKLDLAFSEEKWVDERSPRTTSKTRDKQLQENPPAPLGWKEVISSDLWAGVCLIGPMFIWLIFVIFVVTGIDLLGSSDNSHDAPKMTKMGMLYLTLSFSVVCIPIGLYRYRRAKQILIAGVETEYEVLKYSGIRQGMVDATVEYHIADKTYRKKITVTEEQAEEGFRLIVDPDKPRRFITRPIGV